MNPDQPSGDCPENRQLCARLSATLLHLQPDDLTALAQMHGWCERLIAAAGNEKQRTAAGRAVAQLQALILGEATNPTETFEELCRTIADICGSEAEKPADAADATRAGATLPPAGDGADESTGDALPAAYEDGSTALADEPPTGTGGGPADQRSEPAAVPAPPGTTAIEPYVQEPLRLNPAELEFVKGFVEEAREHIESIECAVLNVERSPEDLDRINDLFRPFHTIKGMAGFLNLRDVNCLTHEAETLLDQGRKGQRKITSGLIDLILDVVDVLKAQVAAIAAHVENPQGDTVPQPPVATMIDRLRRVSSGLELLPSTGTDPASSPLTKPIGEALVEQGVLTPLQVEAALQIQQESPNLKTGEILMQMGVVSARQVAGVLRGQRGPTVTESPAADRTPAEAGPPAAQSFTADSYLRINTAKLDALIDMVGELVIAQTLVSANAYAAGDARLSKDINQVSKIVRRVQEASMAMRMVEIGGTFQKMARLVRDVARKARKQVDLTISGEDTELDKNVIQQINDPLVHMVRNAVDHGIEAPEVRRAAGKDPTGHVHLAAYHQGGNVVIEISDDGKGLDPQGLIAKGIEKGLVRPDEQLSDQQAYQLIFAPGFSTAATITEISGRGVGMDVVRRNIEALRGKVEIASVKGRGTTFYIRLPLTLAIIDGMVVAVGRERFIVPTIAIEQALRPLPEQLVTVQHRGEMIQARGRLIPLIQLGQIFGLTGRLNPCEHMVVITHCDGQPLGIVVEDLIGQQQVVIKSLGERFEQLKGTAGAAILGNGRVGLILDPPGLVTAHEHHLRVQEALRRKRATSRPGLTTSRKIRKEPSATVEAGTPATSA